MLLINFLIFMLVSLAQESDHNLGFCVMCHEDISVLRTRVELSPLKDFLGCQCTALCCANCKDDLVSRQITICPTCRSYTGWGTLELTRELVDAIHRHEPVVNAISLIRQLSDPRQNAVLLGLAVNENLVDWTINLLPNALVDQSNEREERPLHNARSLEIAADLVREGADVEARTQWGSTALHIAAFHGRLGVIQALLANNANVHAVNEDGQTPLHLARMAAITRALLNKGALINAKDRKANYPLHTVLHHGGTDLGTIELLTSDETIHGINDFNEKPIDIAKRVWPNGSEVQLYLEHYQEDSCV